MIISSKMYIPEGDIEKRYMLCRVDEPFKTDWVTRKQLHKILVDKKVENANDYAKNCDIFPWKGPDE